MPRAGNQDKSRPTAGLRIAAALVNAPSRDLLGWWLMDIPPRWRDEKSKAWAPEQIVVAALVFAFGLFIGAGVVALLWPPA